MENGHREVLQPPMCYDPETGRWITYYRWGNGYAVSDGRYRVTTPRREWAEYWFERWVSLGHCPLPVQRPSAIGLPVVTRTQPQATVPTSPLQRVPIRCRRHDHDLRRALARRPRSA